MQNLINIQSIKRIDTYDYMKCIAIIIVVMGHLYNLSYDEMPLGPSMQSKVNQFIQICEMPLFFFLSGLFAKSQVQLSGVLSQLKSKFFQLILPFFACGILAAYFIREGTIQGMFQDYHKYGYWFLQSLFMFYIYFYGISLLFRVEKASLRIALYFCSIFLLYIVAKILIQYNPSLAIYLNAYALKQYYLFFVLGYLFKQYQQILLSFIRAKLGTIVLFGYIFIIISLTCVNITGGGKTIINILASISVILILYFFIENHKNSFPLIMQRSMLYIGRHTLDIYVLHYFLIPTNQPWMHQLFGISNGTSYNVLFEILGGILISLIVILGCIMLSTFIRMSKLMSLFLLGDNRK